MEGMGEVEIVVMSRGLSWNSQFSNAVFLTGLSIGGSRLHSLGEGRFHCLIEFTIGCCFAAIRFVERGCP